MSCPECFTGSVHTGTPRGTITTLHGFDAYVSEPPEGRAARGIVVIVPDAFGWAFVNNRLLADHYAAKGDYTVYLPDFMEGRSAPVYMIDSMRSLLAGPFWAKPYHLVWALTGMLPFLYTNRIGRSFPRVQAFFEKLRQAQGADARIAGAGFCWGGKHIFLLSHGAATVTGTAADTTAPLLNAGFVGHPSFFAASDVAAPLTVPIAAAVGRLDITLAGTSVETLRRGLEAAAPPNRGALTLYDGCGHGFCVRADSTYNDVAQQAALAEDQCIAWFQEHLGA